MAIELISTVVAKNNGGFAIALSNEIKGGIHSKNTIAERNAITSERMQEGMLCYVKETHQYYRWIDGAWEDFSMGSNVGGSDTQGTPMYRVDTYEDLLKIDIFEVKDGTLCHVKEDINENYLYYFHNKTWRPTGSKYQLWIGTSTPPSKNYLWVDTSNMVIDDNPDNITIDNYPTFIDTSLIQYMKEQIQLLNNKIKILQSELKEAIKNGVGNGNNNSGGSNVVIKPQGTFFSDEEGNFLITEDGNYFITEDSIIDGYTPEDEGNVSDATVIVAKGTYLTDENGNYIITEDGNYIITEDSIVDEYTPDEEGTIINGGNNNNNNNNNNDDDKVEIEDIAYSVKGGRVITVFENEELLVNPITQVTIYNESSNEINLIINGGEIIPLSEEESLCFGDIEIESIVVVEKGSIIKYIGI